VLLTRAAPDWGALQSAIAGELVLPGSPDYESVRNPAGVLLLKVWEYMLCALSGPENQ